MVETFPIFTEIIQLRPMQTFLNHYVKSLKIGFEWEGLLIGQLFFILVPVLSFQDKRKSYVDVLISFFLIFSLPLIVCNLWRIILGFCWLYRKIKKYI